jgi:1,4-dihydroxy-2-naphthoate octaprenyltransferase
LDIAALGLSPVFGWVHLALTLVIVLLGIVYSVGSSPWKNHPWLGLISNAIGHGLVVFLFGVVISGRLLSENWIGGLAYTLAVGAVYLATTVPDVEGDSRTGKRTLAVAWGARATMIVSGVLVSIVIVLAAWSNDRYLAFAGIAAWPFFLRAVLRPSSATIAAKAAVGALSVAAAVAYPLYVILLLSGFVATRLFFRWRFGGTYPTFV